MIHDHKHCLTITHYKMMKSHSAGGSIQNPNAALSIGAINPNGGFIPTDKAQYFNPPLSPGMYTCITFTVDLAHTCDATKSYYQLDVDNPSDNYNCHCNDASVTSCPPWDVSASPALYLALRVGA